jgi:predicted DNA-binding transcriptional regulator AlpA
MKASTRQRKPDSAERRRRPPVPLPAVLPELLDANTFAALLTMSRRSFDRAVSDGTLPGPDVRLSAKFVRWRKASALAAIDALAAQGVAQ